MAQLVGRQDVCRGVCWSPIFIPVNPQKCRQAVNQFQSMNEPNNFTPEKRN